MRDPSLAEMQKHLARDYGSDADPFDIAEACYWYASDYHSGQWSHLYAALCASDYSPGPCRSAPESGSLAADMYESLESEFGKA